ncbi:MAG: CarD family transcriptional regulator [Lachnospiraceae bacterium]|nr:CarD family transcriptional regulator [Lachnospiraceae bacterium]
MYEKGEYVVYGQNGICQVQDITEMQMPGAEHSRTYYVLIPETNNGNTIYIPVDNERLVIRRVLSKAEAERLREELIGLEPLQISGEKAREPEYKAALRSCDCRQWAQLIKTLYLRKQERVAQGKKMTSTDERYLKQTEDCLYQELAMVLGMDKKELQEEIAAQMMDMITA